MFWNPLDLSIHDTFETLQLYNDTTNNNQSTAYSRSTHIKIMQQHNDTTNNNGTIIIVDKKSQKRNKTKFKYPTLNRECFKYLYVDLWKKPRNEWIFSNQCIVNMNASYSMYFRITKTLNRRLNIIQSLNEWDKSKYYMMKTDSLPTKASVNEYGYISYLNQFCNETNECHTYRVFDEYPLIQLTVRREKYLVMIMEYLSNTTGYKKFIRESPYKQYAIHDQINFINDCMMNVSIVLDQLWKISILHNDIHGGNILVSNEYPHKCYLIDFNNLFHFDTKNTTDVYHGHVTRDNPFNIYYLKTYDDRNKYLNDTDKTSNNFDNLKQYGYQSQTYNILTFMLDGVAALLQKLTCYTVLNRFDPCKYFDYVTRATHDKNPDNIKNVWCCRIEGIIYSMKILKGIGYNDNNDTLKRINILQNMHRLYHQLKNEILHFNISCNKCVLPEKVESFHLKSPISNLSEIFNMDLNDITDSLVQQNINASNETAHKNSHYIMK